jgi:hypothetical protein
MVPTLRKTIKSPTKLSHFPIQRGIDRIIKDHDRIETFREKHGGKRPGHRIYCRKCKCEFLRKKEMEPCPGCRVRELFTVCSVTYKDFHTGNTRHCNYRYDPMMGKCKGCKGRILSEKIESTKN